MRDHKDPTTNLACAEVTREWRNMARLAIMLREGNNKPEWTEEKTKLFKGIYKRLLEDPIDSVKMEARTKHRY